MKTEKRFFIWDDGDGHTYCVPVELRHKIDEIDSISYGELGYDLAMDRFESLFSEIENDIIKFEGNLTFTNPITD